MKSFSQIGSAALLGVALSVEFGVAGVTSHNLSSSSRPTVRLDHGTFLGNGSGNVTQFLGIPYALSPTGDRRLRLPESHLPYNGTYNATTFGLSCPQQPVIPVIPNEEIAQILGGSALHSSGNAQGEDCLTVNVWVPKNVTKISKLPVMAYIYGGGFQAGETATYDGGVIVQKSLDLGLPVVYISMNHRLSAYGFLGGAEIKKAGVGNLGLQDQRLALRWVQKYIDAFGGDPKKVIIWGESAGAISVGTHMLTNDGNAEGLFRGGIMQSGSPLPVGDITHGQKYYDFMVERTGCAGANDTLQCLRQVPYQVFQAASNSTPSIFDYQSVQLPWWPRVDGVFLKENAQLLIEQGKVADVPFISGDCDDEGTFFSLSSLNVTTDDEARHYIASNYYPQSTADDIDRLMALYPSDPAQGSPFDTGADNALSPQYKRLAALQGDLAFQAPRRFFLRARADAHQRIWAFLSKRLKSLPYMGSFHGSDDVYGSGNLDLVDFFVRFAHTLNPNVGAPRTSAVHWPRYSSASPTLMTFQDGAVPLALSNDTYRSEGFELLTQLTLEHPF